MKVLSSLNSTSRYVAIAMLVACAALLPLSADEADPVHIVETQKDEDGWRLIVDGRDFQVKGVVWAFTPIGENYTYDLWSKPEDYIRRMVDTDMVLLKDMGVTAIRSFSTIPPEWIEYIYTRYGIMTIVNDLFGRYGVTVDGVWQANTDYSDPAVRAFLLNQVRETWETYRNTRGVLFYMLGNESNYGLEWTSGSIENLPSGQRMDTKARYLYSLFGEAIALGKSLDPNRPVGIVNGDLGYLEMMAELCPDIDILGVNTYRGRQAYKAFYASVEDVLDKPIVFTEFGADAFNIKTGQEDQFNQASFLKDQWEELYSQAWGKGRSGNVLGGFVFEWIDEWWKHGMEAGLDIHDTLGTWRNGAYDFDAMAGKNNMNEEWFGIVAQSTLTEAGINRRIPRAAYYLLRDIWTLDLYRSSSKQIRDHFAQLSIAGHLATADHLALRNDLAEKKPLAITGSLESRGFITGTANDLESASLQTVKEATVFRHLETASLSLDFRPDEQLAGGFTLKLATPGSYFETDGTPLSWFAAPASYTWQKDGSPPLSLYSAWARFEGSLLNADLLYRTGHADWVLTGDFFGFLPEAFDRYSMDLNKQEAPFGVELSFKETLDGLVVYGGPELYAGAMPMVMVKYWKRFGDLSIGLVHQEEIAYPDADGHSVTELAEWRKTPLTRRSSLYGEGDFLPAFKLQLGLMLGSPEKIGQTFTNAVATGAGAGTAGSDWLIYEDRPTSLLDALGAKLRVSTAAVPYLPQLWVQGLYLGPLADGEPAIARAGSLIADPGTGNRIDLEAGALFQYGNIGIAPKFLWRTPVYQPLPSIPLASVSPRTYTDLFHVMHNREALRAEVVATWDPTGATWFHEWNNDDREEADFAASLGFTYDFYLGPTDSGSFVADSTGAVSVWPAGLPAISGTWALTGRLVARPAPTVRLVSTLVAGRGQSGGDPARDKPADYLGGTLRLMAGQLVADGELYLNAWGPEPWYREFHLTFPVQFKAGLSWAFGKPSFMDDTNRVGLALMYRGFDAMSPTDQSANGTIDGRYEIQTFVNLSL